MTVDADGLPLSVSVMPPVGGAAYQNVDTVLDDDFFTQTDFKGAFGSDNWLEGWSVLSELDILGSDDNNNPNIVADKITLLGNYPNPFNPSTEIMFELGQKYQLVHLSVFNLIGRKVYERTLQDISAGFHRITWNGSDINGSLVPSGLYLYRVSTETRSVIGKMTLLK